MSENTSSNACYGVGFGNLCAAFISWTTFHSLGWMVIHGIFGWLYVIYWAFGLSS